MMKIIILCHGCQFNTMEVIKNDLNFLMNTETSSISIFDS